MKLRNTIIILILVIAVVVGLNFNKKSTGNTSSSLHEKSGIPNYSVVFPNNKVNRIDIKISKKEWAKMQADLASNLVASHRMPPMHDNERADESKPLAANGSANINEPSVHHGPPPGGPRHGMENGSVRYEGGNRRMGPPGGKTGESEYKPLNVLCTVQFDDKKWSNVGIRYKGNSSLRSAYQQGIKKLSFKLDFDQFEDEFPEIKNQRFYGFQQLNLKNNYDDKSFIREKVASDLFDEFGLHTPKTAFYQVYVNYGEGPQYFGLYTMVEEVDDSLIKTAFSSDDGNLYKPEGRASTFAEGSFRTTDMNKKNNKKSKDFSDVQKLNTVLNSSLRAENYELWKAQLSEIFDVPVFLKWLAANTVMQNWDTYGNSVHNYYLYNNPSTHKLQWIPWDNNEAFQHGKMRGALSLSFDETGDDWPLIRYIIDDADWNNEYKKDVADFETKVFDVDKMILSYNSYKELLNDFVVGEQGEKSGYTFLRNDGDYAEAIEFMKQQVLERKVAVQDFLESNNM